MSESEVLHNKAMQLASLAFISHQKGNEEKYLSLSKEALELEMNAALLLEKEHETEPTR